MPSSAKIERAKRYLEERFGISRNVHTKYTLIDRGDIWIASTNPDLEEANLSAHGIRLLRDRDKGFKPTTYGLQLLAPHIEQNIINLSHAELRALLQGDHIQKKVNRGYVALQYDGTIIGCGFAKNNTVSSRIPKNRAQELASFLFADEE